MLGIAAKRIIFIGRVQGVGFRFTAHRIANRHYLTGYVRNLPDGSVEMVAQGRFQDINNCVSDIKDALPGYINETKITDLPDGTQYSDFRITY